MGSVLAMACSEPTSNIGDASAGEDVYTSSQTPAEDIGRFPASLSATGNPPSLPTTITPLSIEQAKSLQLMTLEITSINRIASELSAASTTLTHELVTRAIINSIATECGIEVQNWIDLDRPVRFAMLDPKRYPRNGVFVLPLRVGATVPTSQLKHPAHPALHLHYVHDQVIVTNDHRIYPELAMLFDSTPSQPAPTETTLARSELFVENTERLFASELTAIKRDSLNSEQHLGLRLGTKLMFELAETTEQLNLHLTAQKGQLRLALNLKPRADTALVNFAQQSANARLKMPPSQPTTWLSVAIGQLDEPPWASSLREIQASIFERALRLEKQHREKLESVLFKLSELEKGPAIYTFSNQSKAALSLTTLRQVVDRAQLETLNAQLVSLINQALRSFLIARLGEDPKQRNAEQELEMVDFLASKVPGVELSTRQTIKENQDTHGVELRIDVDAISELVPEVSALVRALSATFQFGYHWRSKHIAFGVGPSAIQDAKNLTDAFVESPVMPGFLMIHCRLKETFSALSRLFPAQRELQSHALNCPNNSRIKAYFWAEDQRIHGALEAPLKAIVGWP